MQINTDTESPEQESYLVHTDEPDSCGHGASCSPAILINASQSHIFKQPNQSSLAACFAPGEICLKRHPKSLGIDRILLPKPNYAEKPTSTKPDRPKQIVWPCPEQLGYASYTLISSPYT